MKKWRSRFDYLVRSGQAKLQPLKKAYSYAYDFLIGKPASALLIRTIREFSRDRGGDLAAVIAYNVLLSIFPLLLGLTAILGLFLPSGQNSALSLDVCGSS